MAEPETFMRELIQAAATSATITAIVWGAAGGASAALAVSGIGYRAALRLIMLGGLFAGGVGGGAVAILVAWLGLDPALIPIAAGGGSASYLAGLFGPSLVEVILARIRRGNIPTDKIGGGDA